jgi:anti-sigma regulatory factor (Ser/Thr protein kinase)
MTSILLGDLRLPIAAESVHATREYIGLLFDSWHIPDIENAQLCISELSTNVYNHANNPGALLRIIVTRTPDRVRVEVHDSSTANPRIQTDASLKTSGNGLFLVDAVATAWGYDITPTGKQVWFELKS